MKKPLFRKLENGLYEFSTSTFDLVDCLVAMYGIYPLKGADKNGVWLGQKTDEQGRSTFRYLLTLHEKEVVDEVYKKFLNNTDDKIFTFMKRYIVTHRQTLCSHREHRFCWDDHASSS